MDDITQAQNRLKVGVRLVTTVYTQKAMTSLDTAGNVGRFMPRTSVNLLYRCAWSDMCEWISIGWDLSKREDLLTVWRDTSASFNIVNYIEKARTNAFTLNLSQPDLYMTRDHINYYDSGRKDLHGLSTTTLRSIPKDEYDEYVWDPEGLSDFFSEECTKVKARAQEMDILFRKTPMGKLVREDMDPDKT